MIDLQRGYSPAVKWLSAQGRTPLFVSAATVLELSFGADTEETAAAIEAMLNTVSIIAIDAPIAMRAGAIARRYGAKGVGRFDALIAATSLVAGVPLVTLNIKHFPMLKGLKKPY
jgi:predicted nucleic acid-binding protein